MGWILYILLYQFGINWFDYGHHGYKYHIYVSPWLSAPCLKAPRFIRTTFINASHVYQQQTGKHGLVYKHHPWFVSMCVCVCGGGGGGGGDFEDETLIGMEEEFGLVQVTRSAYLHFYRTLNIRGRNIMPQWPLCLLLMHFNNVLSEYNAFLSHFSFFVKTVQHKKWNNG